MKPRGAVKRGQTCVDEGIAKNRSPAFGGDERIYETEVFRPLLDRRHETPRRLAERAGRMGEGRVGEVYELALKDGRGRMEAGIGHDGPTRLARYWESLDSRRA